MRAPDRRPGEDLQLGGERAQQRGGVGDRPRHGAGVVELAAQRHHAVQRDRAPRGLDRADARERGRDPQRPAGVGSQRRRHHARGQRGRRAAARAARGAIERPRVADLVGRAARGELVRVGMAHRHHALRAQPRPGGAVGLAGRRVLEHAAGGGDGHAPHGVEVLDRQGDAAHQRRRLALRAQALVGGAGELGGQLGIEPDPGVDRVRLAVEGRRAAVAPGDALLAGGQQLGGRQLAPAQERRGLQEAQVGGVRGHRAPRYR